MKKLFSIIATFALLATTFVNVPASAAYSAELEEAYGYAYGMGITTMTSIDNADMYGTLTRVALAKMISNYVIELGLQTADTSKECKFTDVSAALDAQYDNWVTNACQLGLMGVGISSFRPFDTVTRAEFGTVLSRAIWGDANNGSDPYYTAHLNALKAEGIMTNISNPNMTEVRGYVMLMMQRADTERKPAICMTPENIMACLLELDSCPAECKGDDEEVVVLPGFLTISKVSAPSQQEVPYNASLKNVGTVKITAWQNWAKVSSLVVSRSGLGSNNVAVKLENANITTDARNMNSNGEATVRFSPALELKANESMTFDVLVSLNADQNEVHTFTVASANIANGTVSGTATLGTIRTTSYEVSSVTATHAAAINSLKAGETNKMIGRVSLQAGSRDAVVKGFTLTRKDGPDFDKSFNNIKAFFNNQEVGTVKMTRDKIVVSNLSIDRLAGQIATIELRADGIYIWETKDVLFGFDSFTDVSVLEKSTNEAMQLIGIGNNLTVKLEDVKITLTKTTAGSKTVAPGVSSVTLFEAKVDSSTEFDVTEYAVVFEAAAMNLTHFVWQKVTLYVNGSPIEVLSGDLVVSGTTLVKTFGLNDRFSIAPKTPATIKVTANISSDDLLFVSDVPYQVRFEVRKVRDVANSSNSISFTAPFENVLGDTTTISKGSITLKNATVAAPASRNVWANASNIEVARFATRGVAEDITVSKITFTKWTGQDDLTKIINSARLVNVATNQNVATNGKVEAGTIVFESMSLNVEKDVDLDLRLVVDTKSFDLSGIILKTLSFVPSILDVDTNRASGWEATITNSLWDALVYNVSIKSPEVVLTKKNASTFTVVVKNLDTENDLSLETIVSRIRPVAENSNYTANYCLREQGSSETNCATLKSTFANVTWTSTWTVPGASTEFKFAAAKLISKNGGTYTFEIYVDSNFVNPPTLLGELTKVTYDGGSENYELSIQ